MTWCGYIFQSGQAFEQWPAVGPFIPWVASQQQSQPFRHHPAYQTASIPLQREHWGHELWTPFLDPLLQERLRIPASILHKQPSREGGRCASPSCTHHLLPFHTSLVALFQQPIFFRSLQSVLLRNGSHWGLQQPNSHIKQMLHFFMWSIHNLQINSMQILGWPLSYTYMEEILRSPAKMQQLTIWKKLSRDSSCYPPRAEFGIWVSPN